MRKYIIQFLKYLKFKNVSHHTLRNYNLDLQDFFIFLKNKKIDKWQIRKYLVSLHDQGKKVRTTLRKISTLRSFFRYLLSEKLINNNPMDHIENPKKDKKLPKVLTYEQVKHFFNSVETSKLLGFRDRCIMELFYSSALRLSELVSLNREDIDFSNNLLRIKGKGKKERIVPITNSTLNWIKKYLIHPQRKALDYNAIFLNKWGKRISERSVDRNFKRYLQKSNIGEDITPHAIRHTIATHWLENGMDLKIIQKILGHSSLATTTIYTHVTTKMKRETYKKTHPRA